MSKLTKSPVRVARHALAVRRYAHRFSPRKYTQPALPPNAGCPTNRNPAPQIGLSGAAGLTLEETSLAIDPPKGVFLIGRFDVASDRFVVVLPTDQGRQVLA